MSEAAALQEVACVHLTLAYSVLSSSPHFTRHKKHNAGKMIKHQCHRLIGNACFGNDLGSSFYPFVFLMMSLMQKKDQLSILGASSATATTVHNKPMTSRST